MILLPWLLDWPPRPRSVLAFLVVTAFSVGTLVLFAPLTDQMSPDESTVEVANVSVHLNDEIEMPDVESDTVVTCTSSGTPGDHLAVRAHVVVETPLEGDEPEYDVEVSLGGGSATTTEPVRRTGRERVNVFWVVRDDEALSVGETAEVRVRLRKSGTVVASASRAVTVAEARRSYDCET